MTFRCAASSKSITFRAPAGSLMISPPPVAICAATYGLAATNFRNSRLAIDKSFFPMAADFIAKMARMKLSCAFIVLALCAGCLHQRPLPEKSFWSGVVELAPGVPLPFQMSLDLSDRKPAGYFLNGEEKTPIPEIQRDGNNLTLKFAAVPGASH